MLLTFEKKITKNQKMRVKFSADPEKFMESEMELHDQIQELYTIGAYPELFVDLVDYGSMPSILGMITHENTDISLAALGLLQELLDSDQINEENQSTKLVRSFVENQGIELIIQNLSRLDESSEEDAQGVQNTLTIIENLVDIDITYAEKLCSLTNLLSYLLTRIQRREFDANKLYASEILSLLLQSSGENRNSFIRLTGSSSTASESSTAANGLDALLQVIAPYKKKEPSSLDETVRIFHVSSLTLIQYTGIGR